MARTHKPVKPSNLKSFRITEREERDAREAARLETARTGRKVGWTTLVRTRGMTGVRRILRKAAAA